MIRSALASLLIVVSLAYSASAQISRSVGLLKGTVTNADGTPLPNVTVVVFRGVERVTSTKSNPQGDITSILQPNGVYRFVIDEKGYLYHEDTLSVPALSAYREFPLHIALTPLRDGQLLALPEPVFEPRSHQISPAAYSELDAIAFQLKHLPKLAVSIVCYPDAPVKTKRDAAQRALASARQAAMSAYFSSKGIASDRVSVVTVTTTVPDGRFPMPAGMAGSKYSRKKRKAPAEPTLFPQYVEIMAHIAP